MLYDLSHEIYGGMPFFPGTRSVHIADSFSFAENGFAEKEIRFLTHTGTHVDAPAHMIKNGKTLDSYPPSSFACAAAVVPLGTWNALDVIRELESEVKFVILMTEWDRYWGKDEYFKDFPVPDYEIISQICSGKFQGVGIDTPSIDLADSRDFLNHRMLFAKDMLVVENLTGLKQIAGKKVNLFLFPLKIRDSDGCPVRVVADDRI